MIPKWIWKTQKLQNKWLMGRKETREDGSILSKVVLLLQIEQARPDGILLQKLPEEIVLFPRTETLSPG